MPRTLDERDIARVQRLSRLLSYNPVNDVTSAHHVFLKVHRSD